DDEQLSTITFADACKFMKDFYVPERATVIVAGGINTDEVVTSINKWFGGVAKRAPAPRRKVDPVNVSRDRKTVELDIERPYLTVAWALPDATTTEGENVQNGVWGAFFDAAQKANKFDCATSTQPMILGGQEA